MFFFFRQKEEKGRVEGFGGSEDVKRNKNVIPWDTVHEFWDSPGEFEAINPELPRPHQPAGGAKRQRARGRGNWKGIRVRINH